MKRLLGVAATLTSGCLTAPHLSKGSVAAPREPGAQSVQVARTLETKGPRTEPPLPESQDLSLMDLLKAAVRGEDWQEADRLLAACWEASGTGPHRAPCTGDCETLAVLEARTRLGRNHPEAAIALLTQVVAHTQSGNLLAALADAYLTTGNPEAALLAAKPGLHLNHPELMCAALEAQGQLQPGPPDLLGEAWARYGSTRALALWAAGNQLRRGNLDEGCKMTGEAREKFPGDTELGALWAGCLVTSGGLADAAAVLEEDHGRVKATRPGTLVWEALPPLPSRSPEGGR